MQDTVLERSLVVEYTTEIWMWNFKNFMWKLSSKVEICWKRGTFDHVFLNNFLVLSIFLGHIYIFWKFRM
jgi:hypothetical protein